MSNKFSFEEGPFEVNSEFDNEETDFDLENFESVPIEYPYGRMNAGALYRVTDNREARRGRYQIGRGRPSVLYGVIHLPRYLWAKRIMNNRK